ncbi:MAG: RNA-binding protein [Euryarchaeota archaeon]|nr:RNA-binding protein [Euryarchaeota archaeon]
MVGKNKVCTSSGVPLVSNRDTSFKCPECGYVIGRSEQCRVQGIKYICPDCAFTGP